MFSFRVLCLLGIIIATRTATVAADRWVQVIVGPSTHVGLWLEQGTILECDGRTYSFDSHATVLDSVPPCDIDPRKVIPKITGGSLTALFLLIPRQLKVVPNGWTINDPKVQASILSRVNGSTVKLNSKTETLQVFDLNTGKSLNAHDVKKLINDSNVRFVTTDALQSALKKQ